jgi:hypothetical protein
MLICPLLTLQKDWTWKQWEWSVLLQIHCCDVAVCLVNLFHLSPSALQPPHGVRSTGRCIHCPHAHCHVFAGRRHAVCIQNICDDLAHTWQHCPNLQATAAASLCTLIPTRT